MDLARFWRHVAMSPARARRAFPPAVLDAIGREVAAREKRHRGQVVFVVEAELASADLLRGLAPRERAREVFAAHGVWNTEENTGVLIYVLLADRQVEVVADRGVSARVPPTEWRALCAAMERRFAAGAFEAGALEGVRAVADLLERHFPAAAPGRNELPDRPALI